MIVLIGYIDFVWNITYAVAIRIRAVVVDPVVAFHTIVPSICPAGIHLVCVVDEVVMVDSAAAGFV